MFPVQVKAIEKRDAVLTSAQQIERLLRPGSTYFNLNPYEVSQVRHSFVGPLIMLVGSNDVMINGLEVK